MNRNADGTFAKTKHTGATAVRKKTSTSNKARGSTSKRTYRKNSITYSTKGFTPKMRLADKSIDTSECSSTTRRKVLSAVAENFTKDELVLIRDNVKPVISDRNTGLTQTQKGMYDRALDKDKQPRPTIKLAVEAEVSTITHEFTHHLRTIDDSRSDYAKTAYPIDSKKSTKTQKIGSKRSILKNAEESATVAETELRLKEKSDYVSGHWPGYSEREKREVRDIDRKTIRKDTNNIPVEDGKNITGSRAIEYMNRNYPKTIVSQKREGDKTALETFREIINKRRKHRW